MSNWKEYKFSELCNISRGASPRPIHEYITDGEGMPWVKIADATKSNSRFIEDTAERIKLSGVKKSVEVFEGDLILSNSATPGLPKFMAINACIHDGWMLLRNFKNITKEFAYWLLLNERNNLVKQGTGTVFINLKTDILRNHIVKIPSIEEQNKIVSILNGIEDKIHLNTQINQTLEQIAQALFKSWFVDFDPVRAKAQVLSDGMSLEQAELAAMQAISGKTAEELTALSQTQPERYAELAETAKAFPCEMVEIDGVEVPKGWAVKPFGSLLENTIGGDWGKEEEDEKHTENVFVFRGTDLPNVQKNEFDAIPKRYIAKNKLKSRKAKYGDIIIEVSGGSKNQPTGRSLLITKNLLCNFDLPIIPASFCRLFTPINEQIAVLLACHLKMIYTQGKTWEYQVQSTGISNFQTTNFLENELLVIPDENILNAFYEKVGVIFEKMTLNENMLLSKTRDLLLPRLLNGEI
ncbi:restriction endonuclease subunit S [Haemophilus influenzae]|uniref:restriction endonuclease subunit S n=1 Tax=Haemophilus influenzae TaxID=727 RepID=UPI000E34EBA1|nr:restriction endonuclease subunit S [Haemophilus influenzae]MCK8932291.1 restriction endonuclease subunit S [Haemophilus influenzae]RFO66479.1 restriction endonuclease subunit S [Haemophilus influenzae]RFO70769.1 restriction endonuclease subunit S [Haemophilus influenzae]